MINFEISINPLVQYIYSWT